MKAKTSGTLPEGLVEQVDKLAGEIGSRSAVLEQALQEFLKNRKRRKRDARDLRILNALSEERNREAQDVFECQVEL